MLTPLPPHHTPKRRGGECQAFICAKTQTQADGKTQVLRSHDSPPWRPQDGDVATYVWTGADAWATGECLGFSHQESGGVSTGRPQREQKPVIIFCCESQPVSLLLSLL